MNDMYGDSTEAAPQTDTATGANQESKGDSKTSILPKEFFDSPDLKPGDTVQVEIVRIHDDSVEVKPAGRGGDEEQAEEPQEQGGPIPAQGEPSPYE